MASNISFQKEGLVRRMRNEDRAIDLNFFPDV